MKKNKAAVSLLCCMLLLGLLNGCSSIKSQPESQKQEIAFTIVENRDIPEKLMEVIEKNKADEIRLSYREGENFYLIRGYGEQETGGYSISVKECSEDEENIWFDTQLIGPDSTEKLSKAPSYPYIVIKMEHKEKTVMIT